MIQGVLFDMDGVLIDSEQYISRAAIMMFRENGVNVSVEDFQPFVGMGENRYLGGVAEKYNFPIDIERDKRRTYEIYGNISKGKLQPLPGVHEFINKCRERKLKIAVVTSADEVKMLINLREIGLPVETFNGTINGLQVERKKPFPDIFLKGAKLLDLDPSNCLVVEDAISGVKAGKAAGCKVLALTTSFKASEFQNADWIAENLEFAPDECLMW